MSLRHVQHGSSVTSRVLRAVVTCVLASLGTGCITVYQPLTSLQRPVVVDSRLPNFEGAKLKVRCHAGDDLPQGDAQALCRRLGTLFRNQGAEVDTEVPLSGRAVSQSPDEVKADLVLDVRSRLVHQDSSNLLVLLAYMTATIIPVYSEYSFEQEVTVRDATGSLLASDKYQSRFVEYVGAGVWTVNWVLDLLVRPPEEEIAGDVAKKEFSRDLYGQLSQLMFNAKVRSQVLSEFNAPAPPGVPPAAPAAAPAAATTLPTN